MGQERRMLLANMKDSTSPIQHYALMKKSVCSQLLITDLTSLHGPIVAGLNLLERLKNVDYPAG